MFPCGQFHPEAVAVQGRALDLQRGKLLPMTLITLLLALLCHQIWTSNNVPRGLKWAEIKLDSERSGLGTARKCHEMGSERGGQEALNLLRACGFWSAFVNCFCS